MISPEKAAEVTRKATEDAVGQLIDKEPKFFLNLLKRHHVRNLLLCIECAYRDISLWILQPSLMQGQIQREEDAT